MNWDRLFVPMDCDDYLKVSFQVMVDEVDTKQKFCVYYKILLHRTLNGNPPKNSMVFPLLSSE